MSFGFRVPYQVIVDADFIAEANKCKMDVMRRLEDTLHGEVKPSMFLYPHHFVYFSTD